jgi:hypothetical protein
MSHRGVSVSAPRLINRAFYILAIVAARIHLSRPIMSEDHIPTETIAVPAQDPEQDEKKAKEPKHVAEKELVDDKAGKEDEIVRSADGVGHGKADLDE